MTTAAVDEAQAVDPRTGEVVGRHPASGAESYERALAAAAAAAVDERFLDDGRRARALKAAAAGLRGRRDEIVAIAGVETGLAPGRLNTELERTCVQLELFAEVIDRGDQLDPIIDTADPDAPVAPRPDLRSLQVPIGPVAVFGASNFPLAFSTAGGDTASALAAGCPVVVKAHPAHPGTGVLVAATLTDAFAEAGLPEGAFVQLTGAGAGIELGERLVDDPRIQAVAFTGSEGGGTAIARRAAARPVPIPVYAEMGSVNPVVVTPAAARARTREIADGLATAVTSSGGQLCTKPGLVLVPDDDSGSALVDALAGRLRDAAPETLLSEPTRDRLADGLAELDALGSLERLTDPGSDAAAPGFRATPALYAGDLSALDEAPVRAEHFGPAIIALRYGDVTEAAAALECLGGQLTVSLHSEPEEHSALVGTVAALARLCGRVVFDGFPTGVAVCWAMEHGGPFPASTAPATTSVGMTAVRRFLRPVVLQNAPERLLPAALDPDNPRGLTRRVDGVLRVS